MNPNITSIEDLKPYKKDVHVNFQVIEQLSIKEIDKGVNDELLVTSVINVIGTNKELFYSIPKKFKIKLISDPNSGYYRV